MRSSGKWNYLWWNGFHVQYTIQNQGTKDIKFGSSNDSPTIITAWRIKKAQWEKSPLNVTDCTLLPRHRNLGFYDGFFLHVLCEREIGSCDEKTGFPEEVTVPCCTCPSFRKRSFIPLHLVYKDFFVCNFFLQWRNCYSFVTSRKADNMI